MLGVVGSNFYRWAWLVLLPVTVALAVVVFRSPPASLSARRPAVAPPPAIAASTSGFAAAVSSPESGRIVGEFEHQDAIMLGVNELLAYHPETLCQIVAAIQGRTKVIALISDPAQEAKTLSLLASKNIPAENVRFFFWPAVSMWVRDFGPRTLVCDEPQFVDFNYHYADRELENQLSVAMAATYGMKIRPSALTMEGGNMLSNGRGLCITSSVLIEQNKDRGFDLHAIGAILQRDFRFTQWSYLPPLVGEPTGHVDMYVTLVSANTAVVGQYDPTVDSQNASQLEQAAATLGAVSIDGAPMKIVRMPMPPRPDGVWRTYTNVIYANGVLLVPQYPDYCPDYDRRALEIYRELLPEWEVVGIDASSLISKRGSLHCLSRNLPAIPSLQ